MGDFCEVYSTPVSVRTNTEIIVNSILIIFAPILIFGIIHHKRSMIVKAYKSYPRLRVRPENDQMFYFANILAPTLLLILEIIGLYRIPCIVTYLFVAIQYIFLHFASSKMIVYFFRVNISNLKREKDPIIYKEQRKIWVRRLTWTWTTIYVILPLSIIIGALVEQRDVFFVHFCTGCNLFIETSVIPKVYFTVMVIFLSIAILGTSISFYYNTDVFAQLPEFRFNAVAVAPFMIAGVSLLAFGDLNNSLHAEWLFYSYGVLAAIFGLSFQYHLAVREGELINSAGTDPLTTIIQWTKRMCGSSAKTSPSNITFRQVLSESDLCELFEEYLISEYCVELIRFHQSVVNYESDYDSLNQAQRMERAKEIFNIFIRNGARLEINISEYRKQEIASALLSSNEDLKQDVFKIADKDVLEMLELGAFVRFVSSQMVSKYATRIQPVRSGKHTTVASTHSEHRPQSHATVSVSNPEY